MWTAWRGRSTRVPHSSNGCSEDTCAIALRQPWRRETWNASIAARIDSTARLRKFWNTRPPKNDRLASYVPMTRGELYRVFKPGGDPKQYRIFVVVSRQVLIDSRFSTVICAPVFTNGEGLSTQVAIGPDEGLKHSSWIMCDNLVRDRKSTRLNSSHLVISYAVFCLKKKTTKRSPERPSHGP